MRHVAAALVVARTVANTEEKELAVESPARGAVRRRGTMLWAWLTSAKS